MTEKEEKPKSHSTWSMQTARLFSGSVAAAASRTLTAPIERIKVILQVGGLLSSLHSTTAILII